MSDFGYLEQTHVSTEKTQKYTIDQIKINGVSPVLNVLSATQANKKYYNALMKGMSGRRRRGKTTIVTAETLDDSREKDIELYSKFVITGWEFVVKADGQKAGFKSEVCKDFLGKLPTWIFDELREYCVDPENFSGDMDVDLTAKK